MRSWVGLAQPMGLRQAEAVSIKGTSVGLGVGGAGIPEEASEELGSGDGGAGGEHSAG